MAVNYYAALERLLLTVWVGALWAVGYLAVPTLFTVLDDRMLAGMLAGRMFTAVSLLGLFCGGLLLIGSWWRQRRLELHGGILLAMLVLVAAGEFWVQPLMAALKAEGLSAGSATAVKFARLHGLASILYLLNSVLGLILVLKGPASAPRQL